MTQSAFSEQVGGTHYKDFPIQPIDFITLNGLDFYQGSIVKYICRHAAKGGAQDVMKCIHYARMLLESRYNVKTDVNYEPIKKTPKKQKRAKSKGTPENVSNSETPVTTEPTGT